MSSRQRIVVTGLQGQVVTSLIERVGVGGRIADRFDIMPLGRPVFDLFKPETIARALGDAEPDIIISAAAYTAVDQAETDEDAATVANGIAAGVIARVAGDFGIPVIHLSTDYVFDGSKSVPYVETDPVAPIGAYGRSKLAGEQAVAKATLNHAILRTAWVYSPFGKNFLKTMMKLAETRDALNVVDDQIGNPTCALDIADAVLTVAGNLLDSDAENLRGIFHMTGSGEASWADFAVEIFAQSRDQGGASATVGRIPSSAYPTPAKRPANSRLNCAKLSSEHGVQLADWRKSTAAVVSRLI